MDGPEKKIKILHKEEFILTHIRAIKLNISENILIFRKKVKINKTFVLK